MAGSWLFETDARLRAIARFFLSSFAVLAAYFFIWFLLSALAGVLDIGLNLYWDIFLLNLLMLAAVLGIYKIFCTLADDKPLAFVGLAFRGRWKHDLGMGLALGTLMILAVAGLERVCRVTGFSGGALSEDSFERVVLRAATYLIVFSVAGTAEELCFRGYPYQRLVDSAGPVAATIAFAALFGLVHLGNAGHTRLSTVNTALVGITLAVAYLRTRALWMPIGIHVAWNLVQGYVLGFPVSGIRLPASLLLPQSHGAEFLTGGAYGPEGSVLATGVIVAATVYLLISKRIYVSREMRELVFGLNAPLASEPNESTQPVLKAGGDFREPQA